jgi:hypothetical protein
MLEKFKSYLSLDHTFYSLLVILVGIVGFLLGGGEVISDPVPTGSLYEVPLDKEVIAPIAAPVLPEAKVMNNSGGLVVASKSGTKYHLPTCPGASQIKAENRIEFATQSLALAAGYKPAANCPGLVQ